ncbi:hypothetical protein B0H34DRAFT_707275 [Crassisporium funariophilum]|nr:hypothetical protein B0H34DRAFT_707275 [Crassisporium funariophilum]
MDPTTSLLPSLPAESSDIFSLSDQVLSDRLEFIEEIGFGNWGSVWLCRPKPATTKEGVVRPLGQKIAVKLVHRSKTTTTAARVRSLWNEMKIVRTFKSDTHPSIIPFHSFIITPSYALITMTYLPTLVPVEVEESKAREWFRFLLSGVEFLHKRGVVHNDIKPANILLSHRNVPVLVDFGFAEKYDMGSDTAFHSNLSYGTPEYLSPERARGLPHDTRKSDVWSLGVTFFEILVGRTPFEHSDGEQFSSNEDLEKYWSRTLRGKWVGTWKFSKPMEKLLHRMIAPNADLRCTAMQAIADTYWQAPRKDSLASHNRSSSYTSSIVFEKDMAKLLNMTPSSHKDKENTDMLPAIDNSDILKQDDSFNGGRRPLAKSKSQPRVTATKIQPRKRVPVPPIVDLSPIKASPPTSPFSTANAKENISSFNRLANVANSVNKKKHYGNENKDQKTSTPNAAPGGRRPFGTLAGRDNLPRPVSVLAKKPSGNTQGSKALKVLGELSLAEKEKAKAKESTNVKDRVKEWEREKERLREMERLQEMERERDEIYEKQKKRERAQKRKENAKSKAADENATENEKEPENVEEEPAENEEREWEWEEMKKEEPPVEHKEPKERKDASHLQIKIADPAREWEWNKENIGSSATSPVLPMFQTSPPLTSVFNIADTPASTRVAKETNKGIFKHSIKASIDKTFQLYKSSTLGQVTSGRSTPARGFSFDVSRAQEPPSSLKVSAQLKDGKEAWASEADGSLPEISPLPVIKNAAESEKMAADSRMDRMTIWMRNVEKVVEDAKQNFESSSPQQDIPLPPLPLPLSRSVSQNRTSRLPRRVLAASQIFQADENGNISPMGDTSMLSATGNNTMFLTANYDTSRGSSGPLSAEAPRSPTPTEGRSSLQIPEIHTPSRQRGQRRATVSTRSPEPAERVFSAPEGSPSKRKEKSKSHGNLFQMHIAPISLLEAELDKAPPPEPTPRLSQVLDRNLFIAPQFTSRDDLLDTQSIEIRRDTSIDELTSSPCHVEPYPQRIRSSQDAPLPDTPSRHRIEGVYDRFLMATSGVKRLGKGYQSEHVGPVASATVGPGVAHYKSKNFYTARRPMPPPVSSDDLQRRTASVDELGMMTYEPEKHDDSTNVKEDGNTTVAFVRRAMKLMVPKATVSRRLSRMG